MMDGLMCCVGFIGVEFYGLKGLLMKVCLPTELSFGVSFEDRL